MIHVFVALGAVSHFQVFVRFSLFVQGYRSGKFKNNHAYSLEQSRLVLIFYRGFFQLLIFERILDRMTGF